MKETSDLVPRHIGAVAETITVSLPPDVLMQIARAVAEIMEGRTTLPAAPWMTRRRQPSTFAYRSHGLKKTAAFHVTTTAAASSTTVASWTSTSSDYRTGSASTA